MECLAKAHRLRAVAERIERGQPDDETEMLLAEFVITSEYLRLMLVTRLRSAAVELEQ